jgi:Na+-translocating ferredoxin:NAD+ oxidoreductase RnfE subunit
MVGTDGMTVMVGSVAELFGEGTTVTAGSAMELFGRATISKKLEKRDQSQLIIRQRNSVVRLTSF